MKATASERITMTPDDWRAEGARRFGEDPHKWKFECPSCGHIQAVEDFRPYKAAGATAQSAYQQCIGRYTGARGAFNATKWKPCNYAMYGLFHLTPHVRIVDDGKVYLAFPFAPQSQEAR